MRLRSFRIQGFRRIWDTTVTFGDATFLIGENNVGKSTMLRALDLYLSNKNPEEQDYSHDEKTGNKVDKIVFTAEFINIPKGAEKWRGFKGRILKKEFNGAVTSVIIYRKTFSPDSKTFVPEMMVYGKQTKEEFQECKKIEDFINAGINKDAIREIFGELDKSTNITLIKHKDGLELLDEIWEYDEASEGWDKNPGGIQGNILIKLPKFLLIPAADKSDEIEGKTGALQETMKILFKEVRDASENYTKAQEYLDKLSKELDPKDEKQEFGKMMQEINTIVGNVFPETSLHVETELNDPDTALKPTFAIEMSSNVRTTPDRQGMGSVRSSVFAMLRYRENFVEKRKQKEREKDNEQYIRTLIIGFEEPEIYLHPNAANNMRDEIYNLAVSSNSQMVCTTHSPYMIDLSKDLDKPTHPYQVLNLFRLVPDRENEELVLAKSIAFNTTKAFKELLNDEKNYVKFILKMDDYVARVFFARHIIIIEGDTEEIVFSETIKRIPEEVRKYIVSNHQLIKARGKAAIIALVKYLKTMDIQPFVVHDKDTKEGAIKFNEPIKDALGGEEHRIMLENCMEDILGYKPPASDKPFTAYKYIIDNWPEEKEWEGVQKNWKKIIETQIFYTAFELNKQSNNDNNQTQPTTQKS